MTDTAPPTDLTTNLEPEPPFDPQPYLAQLDGLDMTDAQKREFLTALWEILSAFVDLGFGVSSVQLSGLFEETGAQDGEDAVE